MTAPSQLNPGQNKLEWEKTDKALTEKYQNQQVQDTIAPTAGQLPYDTYYTRLDTIRNNSASATSGSIAADAAVSARNNALKQQEWQRLQAQAQADAMAAGQAYGQNDPNFGSLNYAGGSGAGYSGDWGGGGAQGVANVLRRAGFSEAQLPTMMAIAMAESSWNASATHNNPNGTIDQGLFQINSVHQGNSWYPSNPFDPLQSAIAAYNIYQSQGLNAWTVYKTGDYAKFIPSTIPPAIKAAASGQPAYNGGNYGPSSSSGLAGNAQAAQRFIQQNFGINNIGGFGGGSVSGSDHPKGKALDVMIANYQSSSGISQGNSVAQWFINNPAAYGTKYIIWRDRIWQNGVWSAYSHPSMNNDTGAHRDHVHISFL
jgi:hypothetical protein